MTAQRDAAWQRLGQRTFDLLVIGAGIIGSRIAYEAARAGLDVALVDAGDFGGATSSGSSKLIHGGFRYLPMGDLGLVWESQRERRALMTHVAPHLVRRLPIVLAAYRGGPTGPALAGAGVLAYGAFCGFRGTGVGLVGARGAQKLIPSLRTDGLTVCGLFDEGQTNDSRLVLATVSAAVDLGVTALNHARITDLAFRAGRPAVASVQGGATEGAIEVACKHVINASGPWVDTVRRLEDPACAPMARLSKGVHLLLEPKTEWRAGVVVPLEHGRVTMAIPWQGMLMLGTTDTDYEGEPGGCAVTESDVAQVLAEASLALPCEVIRPEAVRFSFAGLRVLPMGDGSTAGAHREHLVRTGPRGMVSIAGGKLTTHWRIALDVLHRLADSRLVATRLVDDPLPEAAGGLKNFDREVDPGVALHLARTYGRESFQVMAQQHQHANAMERIHPDGPDVWAQAYHAVEHELAATVDDVVRRRTTLAVRGLASPALKLQIARVIAAVG
ncbi:MAG: glycerol-3-phosphate dehydrogenase/oxidase [Candidatus Dormibacteraeota bacterium]|nr:glycerol-3-phosphate dehydrogenase/oxidase [Candidatus Dormibacteraeota bacterium]